MRSTPISRRELLHCALAVPAISALRNANVFAGWTPEAERPYLDAALRAEHWIRSLAIDTAHGRTWPVSEGAKPQENLYSGAAGIVVFYLDLFYHTRERRYLDEAVKGALHLATMPLPGPGLYTGMAGKAWVLEQVYQAGRDERVLTAAREAGALLAKQHETPVTDIVGGTAGVGLSVLKIGAQLGNEVAGEILTSCADRLVAASHHVAEGQRRWLMSPTFAREMPNFSHGTAGVAFFLARLGMITGKRAYREAALDGGRYLATLAKPLIYHHPGDGENLFYLSWCHGPAGTARLWNELYALDRDTRWLSFEEAGAAAIVKEGVPEKRTAGFWNNVSMCCGNAGVADYFLGRPKRDIAYAKRHADDLLRAASGYSDGQWVQAEHRVQPQNVVAQTGWMQGAAGIGAMLLHLDAAIAGEPPRRVVFPDA